VKVLRLAVLAAAALLLTAAASNDPADRLSDPAKEARARALFKEVRCLVCQNESIDDSEADLAGDLRKVVREQVSVGRSDAEVKRYLTDRYGEFVLLKPSFSLGNAVLWLTPFVIVLGGGAVLVLRTRRRPVPLPAPLSPSEEAALAVLDGDAGNKPA
jgi:cytochrome c-type biogenesis protein CcmH